MMSKCSRRALFVLALGLSLAAAPAARAGQEPGKDSPAGSKPAKAETLKWHSFNEGLDLAAKAKKTVLVDVYTNWCGWCKRMDATTYRNAKVIAELNADYVLVKLNAEDETEITYKREATTPERLSHEVFGVTGYPTTVFLRSDGEIITPLPGYREGELFAQILKFIGTGAYRDQKWEAWQKTNS